MIPWLLIGMTSATASISAGGSGELAGAKRNSYAARSTRAAAKGPAYGARNTFGGAKR